METVVFANSWRRFFAEFGLKSFDDFFEYPAGQTIDKNKKRNVTSFVLGQPPARASTKLEPMPSVEPGTQKRRFFIKRFCHPHFKDMLFARRNFGRFCSQARCEWENTKLLLDNNIKTYRPACCGEKTKWGIENKSFIVTEELEGQSLADFAGQKWQHLERRQKEKIIAGMAAFIRRIHALNVSLPDLYVWHIFLSEKQAAGEPAAIARQHGEWEFAVIDLHRMSRNVTDERQKLKNLGRLHHSMVDRYFDEELKQFFIESYASDNSPGNVAVIAAQVKKFSDAVSAKRNPKPY